MPPAGSCARSGPASGSGVPISVSSWPAVGKWTPRFFAERFPDREVEIKRPYRIAELVELIERSDEDKKAPYLHAKKVRTLFPELLPDITPLPDGNISLVSTGKLGQPFSLLASPDPGLPVASWSLLSTGAFTGAPVFTSDSTNAPRKFYRLRTP